MSRPKTGSTTGGPRRRERDPVEPEQRSSPSCAATDAREVSAARTITTRIAIRPTATGSGRSSGVTSTVAADLDAVPRPTAVPLRSGRGSALRGGLVQPLDPAAQRAAADRAGAAGRGDEPAGEPEVAEQDASATTAPTDEQAALGA